MLKGTNTANIRLVCKGVSDKRTQPTPLHSDIVKNQEESSGYRFQDKLDTRDEIIRVPITSAHVSQTDLIQLESNVLEWLATIVENILSVTFRYILEEKLTISQGKAFAAKNILLNIKETCQRVSRHHNREIDEDFIQFIDNSLQEIIAEIMKKYPQTNTKGASNRLKKFIKKISNKENDEYDFLLNSDVNIKYSPTGDYSSDIMAVINKLIDLPQTQTQAMKDSYMEEFHIFCSQLFYFAGRKLGQSSEIIVGNGKDFPSADQLDTFHKLKKNSDSSIRGSLEAKTAEQTKFGSFYSDSKEQRIKVEASVDIANSIVDSDIDMNESMLRFEESKANFFSYNQKIPSEAKLFSEKEIRSGKFKVYHSSILRVMTKWAEEMYQKINQASDKIRQRIHKFKSDSNGLRFCQVEEKEYLYQAAVGEKTKIDRYLKQLKQQNKQLQAYFSSEAVEGVYLKKFTNVGMFAGRLQEILGHLTFKYLNRLIHSLLTISRQASEKIAEHYKIYEKNEEAAEQKRLALKEINLVSFKVGDLIRARYVCPEHQFINILALLYKLEETNAQYLKIIKLKNRLEDNNNDILLNIFFKEKVICEIQLGIFKEVNKKESLYSQFNHFLYELKRSEFGVLSALSNTIAQHDPIVAYFSFSRNNPPTVIKNRGQKKEEKQERRAHRNSTESVIMFKGHSVVDNTIVSHTLFERGIEKPFICSKCKNLRIVHNVKFYYRNPIQEDWCNECIQVTMRERPQQCQEIFQDLFRYYIVDQDIDAFLEQIAIWNPITQLRKVKDENELYVNFLQYGFIIEKGQKLPKVHFFRKTFNQMSNCLILSTIIGGQIVNFLSLDCRKQKNKFVFLKQLDRYILFTLKNCFTKTEIFATIVAKDYILEQTEEISMIELLQVKEKQILKIDYIKYIERSFEKYHSTLYLNNYKFILDYMKESLEEKDPKLRKQKQYYIKTNALHIFNLELESCEIKVLHSVLTFFTNLQELNLSDNYIEDLSPLVNLQNLQKVNISGNKVATISPLTQIKGLTCLIAAHNRISSLQNIEQILFLHVLDVSYNVLTELTQLQGMSQLHELNVSSNYIKSIKGIQHMNNLQKLLVRDNQIVTIEHLQQLVSLIEVNFAANHIELIPDFNEQHRLEKLNLQNNLIKQISWIRADSLKELDLSCNYITEIENLDNLQNLEWLDLSDNKITSIQGLQGLDKLKILNLSTNLIQVIQNLQENKNIEQLRLSKNPITEIGNINHLKSLIKLDIDLCQLQLINEIRKLKRLHLLNLSGNGLTVIDRIDELVRLQKLDLSHNGITQIQNLYSLKYLQNLSLMGNQISKIQNLDLLYELKWIILSGNRLTRLENLNQLDSLSILQAQDNQIERIENLHALQELSQLWLSCNRISKIQNLDRLGSLTKLGLADNCITNIEGLAPLVKLEFLDLQANHISKLQNLERLTELKWLVISLNQITKIEGLNELRSLQTLIMEHNQIKKIENLDKLRRLNSLILNYNLINRIEGLENNQDLQKLYLGGNAIDKIENLQTLTHLNELALNHNKISKMQNLHPLSRLNILNLSHNAISLTAQLQSLVCLKRLDLSNNLIELFDDKMSKFINDVNLTDNPIKNVPSQVEIYTNIRLFANTLMKDYNPDARKHLQDHEKHSILKTITARQNSPLIKENNIYLCKSDLIRTFTKTLITQL